MSSDPAPGWPLRIAYGCIRYPPAPGGAETHVQALARGMAARGHRVLVYTSDLYTEVPLRRFGPAREGRDRPGEGGAELDGAVEVRRFPTRSLGGELHYPVMADMVLALLRAPVDVVHVHSYGYFQTLAGALKRRLQPPGSRGAGPVLVLTPHYHPPWSMWGGERRRALRERLFDPWLGRWTVGAVDALIGVSEHELGQLQRYVGFDRARARVIPNGLHLEHWREPPDGRRFLAEHGPRLWTSGHKEGLLLLYTGRLASNKGLGTLLRALARLAPDHPGLRLALVGADTGERSRLERLARELGVAGRVLFTGHLSKALYRDSFGAADLYVLPSEYEAFGIVLLEAGAAGLPCVATRVGGVPEVLQEGLTGELVEYDDVEGLTRTLAELLQAPQRREEMGAAARQLVLETHGWEAVIDQTQALYYDLLQG